MSFKKAVNAVIKSTFIFLLLITNTIQPRAATYSYIFRIIWNDNNNVYGMRPEQVNFKVCDSDATETVYLSDTLTATTEWAKNIQLDSDWGKTVILTNSIPDYSSVTSIQGTTITKTFTCKYNDASDEIVVDTIWLDNDNANNTRPDTYTLSVSDSFGNANTYDIGKSNTEYIISDFPFIKDGVVNTVTPSLTAISGYTSSASTHRQNGKTHFVVTHTLTGSSGDQFKAGYQTVTYGGATYNIYKMSGNEKLTIMTTPQNSNGTYPTLSIKKFAEVNHIRVKALVNASYFNCNYNAPGTIYNTTTYGRIQGMDTNGNYINSTTAGPGDGVSGDKPYADLVIEPDGTVVFGDLNSWDYHWGDDIGYPNEVMAGVSPAVVEILNGQTTEKYSPAVGAGKMTTKNTQTALLKTADGSFALLATADKITPRSDLKNFGVDNNISELSVYDSGGSTQMMVGTTPIIYTGRTIPDVWVVYEEEDEVDPEEKTFSITFTDIDSGTDLNTYMIIHSFTGGSLSTGIAETLENLRNRGYEPADDSWMNYVTIDYDTLDATITEFNVDMKHIKENVVSHEEKTYTRTIKYVDENGTALKDADVQTLHATVNGSGIKDLVTGEITYDSSEDFVWENDNSTYPEVTVPDIDGYTKEKYTISALNIKNLPESERNRTEEVKYTKKSTIVNVLVQYLDTDETDPQDLSEYGATYSVDTAVHEQADITPVINKLIGKHYIIVDKPVIDGKMQNVIVKVKHDTAERSNSVFCSVVNIPVEYDDGSHSDESLQVSPSGNVVSTVVTDLVTGIETSTVTNSCHVDPFAVPKKDGYIAEPEMITGYGEGETPSLPEKIIYKRIPPETKTISVNFDDTDSDKQDLDAYSKQIVIAEGESKELNISETLTVLENQNYIIDYDTVPETIAFDDAADITVNVSHKKETTNTPAGETAFTREIHFEDSDGVSLKETKIQTATKISILSETTDAVTNKKIESHYETQWRDGINWFESFEIPSISGYETHEAAVQRAMVNENNLVTKVTVVYTKITDIHTFTVTFEDINEDAQDLTSFTKTYDVEMNGNTSTELSEANEQIANVKALGYVVVQRPDTVTTADPVLTVTVDHGHTETELLQTVDAVRTIKFEGIDKSPVEQKVSATKKIKRVKDNVTSTFEDTTIEISGNYPSFTPEVIERYTVAPETVPSMIIDFEDDLSAEATVTYTPVADVHTFTIEFIDINSAAQDLSAYTKTYDIEMSGETSTELHVADEQIETVKSLGYKVVERSNTVTIDNPKLVVKVDHTFTETEFDQPADAVRTITFNGLEKADVKQEVKANLHYERVTDNVTKTYTDTLIGVSGAYPEYVPDQIDGYTFAPETIPAIEISSEDALAMSATVTYSKNEPEPDIHTFTVKFEDINADKQDLSSYTKTYDIEMSGETSTELHEADAQIELVKSLGYKVTARAEEVTVSAPELLVKVDHTYSETTVDQTVEATRTIQFEGISKESIVQKVNIAKQFKRVTDNVTDKSTDTLINISGTFPAYTPDDVEGYTFEPAIVPATDISSEDDLIMNVIITYTKSPEPAPDYSNVKIASDLKFEDGQKEETVGTTFKLINTISYSGIEPGKTYYVRTSLESALDVFTIASRPTGVIYEKDTEFVPESESGTLTIEIQMSAEDIDEDITVSAANKLLDSNKAETGVSDVDTQADRKTVNIKKTVPVIPDRDVYVNFIDISLDPQDLSEYQIKQTVKENEAATVDFSDVYQNLLNRGFVFDGTETTVVVPVDENEITINVTHRIDESVNVEKKIATRTIHFAGIDREDDIQLAEVTLTYTTKIDAVTFEIISTSRKYFGKIPAYIVPQIDEYTSDRDSLPEINFEIADPESVALNHETSITYTSIYANMHDVSIQFIDTNETEVQDLSHMNYIKKIKYNAYTGLDISGDIQQLETLGYILVNSDEIPEKIGNDTEVVTAKFKHGTAETDEKFPVQVTRKISYTGIERNADEQKAQITKSIHTVKDQVTGSVLDSAVTISGELTEFITPEIKGYLADKAKIEAVKFTEEAQLEKSYDAVVAYSRNASEIVVTFKDVNNTERTDLEKYKECFKAYSDFDLKTYLDASSVSMRKLIEKGYILDSTSSDGLEYTVLLKHDVKQETSEVEKTITRTIGYKYISGVKINEISQKAYIYVVTTAKKDAVTGTLLSSSVEKKTVPGKSHVLDAIKVPEIDGFEPSEKVIASVDILKENINDEETVVVIYKAVKKEDTTKKSSDADKQTIVTPSSTTQTATKETYYNMVANTADTFTAHSWLIVFFSSLVSAVISAKLLIDDDKARRRRK